MPKLAATDAAVRNAKPKSDGRQQRYSFAGIPGLMLIVGPRSSTWFVRFTSPIDGKNKLLELGPATWQHDPLAPRALDLSAARAECAARLGEVRKGRDPASEREAKRLAKLSTVSISAICAEWLNSPSKRAGRTSYQDAKQIATYVEPTIGARAAEAFSRADARDWLARVAAGELSPRRNETSTPGVANRLQTLLTCAFDYAIRHDKLAANPFRDQDRLPTKKRERYFTMSELAAIWRTLDDADLDVFPGVRLAIKLQILSGTRANEWTAASWEELDLNDTVPRLVIPASRYKTKVAHLVPITLLMRQQLEAAKTLAGNSPWVFPGRHTGKALRRTSVTDAFARTCERAGVRLEIGESTHVLRHSVETHLRRLQVAPHVVDGVLGHVQLGMRATYNHWHAAPEKLDALAAWENEVRRAIAGRIVGAAPAIAPLGA